MKNPVAKFFPFILLIGFFAFIIVKDVDIPSWLTISLGGLGALALLALGLRKPEIPFYVLVIYLPFNKILSGTFGGFMTAVNMTNILILITIICWIMNGMSTQKKLFENTAFNWVVFLFCLLGVLSVVKASFDYGTGYFMEFIIPLKRWLTPVLLYYLALNLIRDKEMLKNTVIIILAVLTVVGLMTIKESIDIGDAGSLDSSRVNGIAGQPNMMGAFFVYYMFLFLAFFYLNWHKFASWFLLLPFLICFRGIQVTFSRGAYLAFAVGVTAITFFKNKFLFFLICIAILFMVLNPQFLPGGLQYAVSRTVKGPGAYGDPSLEDRVDSSSSTRIEIWKGAAEIIKDHPLTGVGYGVFPYVLPQYVPQVGEMDAHNTFLIIATEMGIPTLLVFLWIILVVFRHSLWLYTRSKDLFIKAVGLGMLGGISGMVIANLFGSRLESEEVSAYFWILSGLIVKAVIMCKRKELA